jgi:hypothetical protein
MSILELLTIEHIDLLSNLLFRYTLKEMIKNFVQKFRFTSLDEKSSLTKETNINNFD